MTPKPDAPEIARKNFLRQLWDHSYITSSHFWDFWTPLPTYVSMFLVLRISKNWHFQNRLRETISVHSSLKIYLLMYIVIFEYSSTKSNLFGFKSRIFFQYELKPFGATYINPP